jgi:Xaa-Pro aminopeptidase
MSNLTDRLSGIDLPRMRQDRQARLRAVLHDADVAGILLFDPINIRYATDVSNMQVWCLHNPVRYLFVATDGPIVLFEFLHCEFLAEGLGTVDEVRPGTSSVHLMAGSNAAEASRRWAAEIADLVNIHGGGNRRLAVDRLEWTAAAELQRHGIIPIEGQPLAEKARGIKTVQEINLIREVVRACEDGVRALEHAIVPGITEHALWSILHHANIAAGGEWIETRLLSSGPRTNPWYQECSDRVLEDGDLVALDTDLIGLQGYCCDISRTWRVGSGMADDRQRRTYADAFDILTRVREAVGPGVSLSEISDAIGPQPEAYLTYSCLVHGVGMCDEYPVAFWQGMPGHYEEVLQPGMTICVESYLGPHAGGEGVKLEDQILITDNGIELLSTLPFQEEWL